MTPERPGTAAEQGVPFPTAANDRGDPIEWSELSRALDATDDVMTARGHRLGSYANEEYAAVLRPLLEARSSHSDVSADLRAALQSWLDDPNAETAADLIVAGEEWLGEDSPIPAFRRAFVASLGPEDRAALAAPSAGAGTEGEV